ncbi:MAG: hypothetical protein ACRDVG_08880 [Jatrophihabitantaceae bacterium]
MSVPRWEQQDPLQAQWTPFDRTGVPAPTAPYDAHPVGFVPLAPPRRKRNTGLIAAVSAVAVALAAFGIWVVANLASHPKPAVQTLPGALAGPPRTPAIPALVTFHSAPGHFSAGFVDRPSVHSLPASLGPMHLNLVIVGDSARRVVVESVAVRPSIPASAMSDALHGALHGVTVSGRFTLVGATATTYRGRPALRGRYTSASGGTMTALAVGYSGRRLFVLFAPSSVFPALLGSFRVTR